MGKDGKFLSRIATVDIHGRVGFGITQVLSDLQGTIVLETFLGHLSQYEIARAVENSLQRNDLVGSKALRDVGDNRDSSPDARFEGDRSTETSCSVEKLFAVLG